MTDFADADTAERASVPADIDQIKQLRERAARLGCRLRKRRGGYLLSDKDDEGGGAGFENLEDAAAEIGRRERGDPITITTPCGIPLYTHDPKTGQTTNHLDEQIDPAEGRVRWRDHLPVHPAADLFPPMSERELRELGEDIMERGLISPIILYQGKLLDGRSRLDAMELVGIALDFDREVLITDLPDAAVYELRELDGDPYDFVVSANLHRRHLTSEQRRELLITLIARQPERSDRQIAKMTGVDHKTIAAARTKGEDVGSTRIAGGFFAIDRGAFRCAAVGGLNAAVAHLVMARGTGRDNRTTQWSVHSIEQRTGISRPNADKAVKALLNRGVWKKIRDGQHPIYEAVCGDQIPGGPFTADEQAAIAALREGNPLPYDSKTAVEALKARGIIRECNGRRRARSFELDTAAIAALTEPLTTWLPNTLIDGAAGEVPPVELIRQTRSLPALRLLVELYAAQFLPNFGGVPRELLKMVFDRTRVGEQGPFVVWGFQPKHMLAGRDLFGPFLTGQFTKRDDGTHRDDGMDASFLPAVHALTDLGLIEGVGMLLDGDDDEAEIIHPYAMRGGEPAENELASAAHYAALPMVTDGQRDWAEQNGYKWLIPVQRHIGNATLIEVYRLKYRPHTAATAAWYAVMQQTTGQYLDHYRAMLKDREISAASGRMQYQG